MSQRFWFGAVMMCSVAVLTSCGPKVDKEVAEKPDATKQAEHEHGDGPHGGAIGDWGGGKYHVEFTVDHGKKAATVYVLGGDAKSAAPIKAEKLLLSINEPSFQVDLTPQPLEGESDGKSSRFVGQHDSLGIVREFAGTISAEVDGKPFTGKFAEQP